MTRYGWIGVDLDGTLAKVDHSLPYDELKVGEPVPRMVSFVKLLIATGHEVRVFTARAAEPDLRLRLKIEETIRTWCIENIGQPLPITCVKDYQCVRVYDDRAVQVEKNTGATVGPMLMEFLELHPELNDDTNFMRIVKAFG